MKVICEKYREEMTVAQAICRHPGEYCKFRSACLIHFITKEKKLENENNLKESNDPASK